MATTTKPEPESSAPNTDIVALGQSIASAIQANAPVQKVPFAKLKQVTPFNSTGNRTRKLRHPVFVNGFAVDLNTAFDEEIALYNKLQPERYLQPAKCIGGFVTVVTRDIGGGGYEIHIWYPNRTPDQRLEAKERFRDRRALLKRILDETPAA